jgi:hypothetical protein
MDYASCCCKPPQDNRKLNGYTGRDIWSSPGTRHSVEPHISCRIPSRHAVPVYAARALASVEIDLRSPLTRVDGTTHGTGISTCSSNRQTKMRRIRGAYHGWTSLPSILHKWAASCGRGSWNHIRLIGSAGLMGSLPGCCPDRISNPVDYERNSTRTITRATLWQSVDHREGCRSEWDMIEVLRDSYRLHVEVLYIDCSALPKPSVGVC